MLFQWLKQKKIVASFFGLLLISVFMVGQGAVMKKHPKPIITTLILEPPIVTPGGIVTVTMLGASGGKGMLVIEDALHPVKVPLKETSKKGTYIGRFKARADAFWTKLKALAHLDLPTGERQTKEGVVRSSKHPKAP